VEYIAVALGGALGALARFLISSQVGKALGVGFPFGTLAVNVIGSFVRVVCAVLIIENLKMPGYWREFVMVGFLGALTTFSTFSLDGLNLLQNGQVSTAILYFVISVIGSVLACFSGWYLTKIILFGN
jgi:CrcB protein